MFRFCLCSHEWRLPRKERIISRALAHPGGLLRKLPTAAPADALRPRLSQVAASDFAFRHSLVEAVGRFPLQIRDGRKVISRRVLKPGVPASHSSFRNEAESRYFGRLCALLSVDRVSLLPHPKRD